MKSLKLFLSSVFLLTTNLVFSQVPKDSIQIKKGFETAFILNSKKLTPKQLLTVMQNNTEAFNEMKIAKSNYDVSNVIGFIGGALIGWQLGAELGGGKANWTSAGIGGGLIVVAIPFASAYTKHAKRAVAAYNAGLNQTVFRKVRFYPGLTSNGVGISMHF